MGTIEIIVPVRPGGVDKFQVKHDPDRIKTTVVECADGNLSRVWRDAYVASDADVVVFKHDDFWFRNWLSYEAQLWAMIDRYPILGVAGARSFIPRKAAWWQQTETRHDFIDGVCRGMVSHPTPDPLKKIGRIGTFFPTFYGPPGPVVVMDGCCIAVKRNVDSDTFGDYTLDDIAGWWDTDFTYHFYDIAFTMNATLAFQEKKLGASCYVLIADVVHQSGGDTGEDYMQHAIRFATKYDREKAIRAK